MATVTCSGAGCGTELGPADLLCPVCGRPRPRASRPSSGGGPPATAPPSDQPTAHPPLSDAREPSDSSYSRDGEDDSGDEDADLGACDHRDNQPGAIICESCGIPITARPQTAHATARRYRLVAPWGDLRLDDAETDIGREVGPFAAQLAAHPTVSRRHATLRITVSGRLHVIDQGSSNGTFKNDSRIEPNIPVELRDRDTVSFSTRLTLGVRAEDEHQ